jgi:hypothetical protein
VCGKPTHGLSHFTTQRMPTRLQAAVPRVQHRYEGNDLAFVARSIINIDVGQLSLNPAVSGQAGIASWSRETKAAQSFKMAGKICFQMR